MVVLIIDALRDALHEYWGLDENHVRVVRYLRTDVKRVPIVANSNSGEFAELRGGDNEVRLWVVPHVARDKVRGSRKRGAEEHLVIGIGECLARICGHDFFAEQLYVHEEFIDTRWR